MSYLKALEEQKLSREKYEQGVLKLKELVMKQEILHNLYNGRFIQDLEKFLTEYKPKDE